MKQFVLDYLADSYAKSNRVLRVTRETPEADMLVELDDGKRIAKVAVFVVNRSIRIPEIRQLYETNTSRKIHSLFLVDGRMMPPEGLHGEPPGWMGAIHSLTHGRIYAYWCELREVIVRPIHIEWRWGASQRRFEYGDPVPVANLRPSTIALGTRQIDGTFATADFGEGSFWKKRDPNEHKERKFTWRDWSFGSARTQSKPPEDEGWDPWEEFQRRYGDVGDFYTRQSTGYYERREQRQRGQATAVQPLNPRHFATLGLSVNASYEEVKRAYRLKARENHPDMHPLDKEKYTLRMAEINAAFEAISKRLKD